VLICRNGDVGHIGSAGRRFVELIGDMLPRGFCPCLTVQRMVETLSHFGLRSCGVTGITNARTFARLG
jgi:hypothetical protein